MYWKTKQLFILLLVLSTAQVSAQTQDYSPTKSELKFLEQHWGKETITLQGKPPANYSSLEASLFPESCGQCHPQQFKDWQKSLHSQAMGPGVLGQLIIMEEEDPETARACWACHTPLAEQQSVLKIEGENNFQKNIHYNEELQKKGLICAACHVRKHQRFGPPPKVKKEKSDENSSDLPHNGFSAETAFTKSIFCKKCHQFNNNGYALNGKLLENTYNEWIQSEYANKGIQCQGCHMPDRQHLWRGIHDKQMVKNALRISISEQQQKLKSGEELKISIKFENTGAGHHFPTYLTPRILVKGYMQDDAQQIIVSSLLEASIGREVPLDLSREIYDTRIPANDFLVIDYQQIIDEYSHNLKIEVIVQPDYFYEKFYRSMLDNNSAGKGKQLIEEALTKASSSEYMLFEQTIPINRVAGNNAIARKPFSMSSSAAINPEEGIDWNENNIQWYSYKEGLQKAKQTNKPIMLIFYADWCPTCHAYKNIFYRDKIQRAANKMIMIRVNVDDNPDISEHYDDVGSYVPRTFVLDPQGNKINISRYITHKFKHFIQDNEPEVFLTLMENASIITESSLRNR